MICTLARWTELKRLLREIGIDPTTYDLLDEGGNRCCLRYQTDRLYIEVNCVLYIQWWMQYLPLSFNIYHVRSGRTEWFDFDDSNMVVRREV